MSSTVTRIFSRCTRGAHRAAPSLITSNSLRANSRYFHYARSLRAGEEAKPVEEATKQQEAKPNDGKAEEAKDYEKLLAEKDKQIKEQQDKILRTLADMQNLRDRTARDAENSRKYAISSFGKDVLEVSDTLEMALRMAEKDLKNHPDPQLKIFHDGILMTEKTLLKVFEKHGISRFEAIGEKFDPTKHDGLYEITDPSKTPGTVGAVLKSGYMMKDRVLRAAQVGTVKAPPS